MKYYWITGLLMNQREKGNDTTYWILWGVPLRGGTSWQITVHSRYKNSENQELCSLTMALRKWLFIFTLVSLQFTGKSKLRLYLCWCWYLVYTRVLLWIVKLSDFGFTEYDTFICLIIIQTSDGKLVILKVIYLLIIKMWTSHIPKVIIIYTYFCDYICC